MYNILTKSQAEAVYRAMCELNNIGARAQTTLEERSTGCFLRVIQAADGVIRVVDVQDHIVEKKEVYDSQIHFANHYKIF